jgi:hypothetical protein
LAEGLVADVWIEERLEKVASLPMSAAQQHQTNRNADLDGGDSHAAVLAGGGVHVSDELPRARRAGCQRTASACQREFADRLFDVDDFCCVGLFQLVQPPHFVLGKHGTD